MKKSISDKVTESKGLHYLSLRVYQEKLNVAVPLIDDGIDLIVYGEKKDGSFAAIPVQLKCFNGAGFVVDKKYRRISGLWIAYIWYLGGDVSDVRLFIMPYSEAERIVDAGKWSRDSKGKYARTSYSKPLEKALKPHEHENLASVLFA